MSSADPTTKGSILRSLVKFIEKDLSADQRSRAVAALRESEREVVEQTSILPSLKISEHTLNQLTVEAARAKGEPLDSFARRAGRAELADAVGIYRFLTVVLTPTALLRKASTLWATIHSHGQLIIESESPGAAHIRLKDFPSEEAQCARLSGWFEGAGEMTGTKDIRVLHHACVARGDADCQWQLTWTR